MKKIVLILLTAMIAVTLFSCTGIAIHETGSERASNQISPVPENIASTDNIINFYYGYNDEQFLVCDSRSMSIKDNEDGISTVLNALIGGPQSANSSFTTLINGDTRIVDISENDNYLFITFSSDFLAQPDDFRNSGMRENVRRYLAVYSVIDTVLEYSNYDFVQIFIDRDNTGAGTPITNEECGLSGDESFEARGRNGSIILNEINTVKEIMASIESKDWNRLYDFVAYEDADGSDRPSYNDFRNAITADNVSISNTEVIGQAWATDGIHTRIFVNFTQSSASMQPSYRNDLSVGIVRERSLWKITYSELMKTFING